MLDGEVESALRELVEEFRDSDWRVVDAVAAAIVELRYEGTFVLHVDEVSALKAPIRATQFLPPWASSWRSVRRRAVAQERPARIRIGAPNGYPPMRERLQRETTIDRERSYPACQDPGFALVRPR